MAPVHESAVDLLENAPPWAVADRLVERASELCGAAAGLYVVDIGGSTLQRVAATGELPEELPIPLTLGPELPERHAEEVVAALGRQGLGVQPLWLRGRAAAVLVTPGEHAELHELAREAAAAIDLADRYTEIFEAARRRKQATPAAELQETLLPPRVAELRGADFAGTVVPAYEVGGDWFDYAETAHGTWIAVGDAAGKGPRATALSALALSALRAERRREAQLERCAEAMHQTVRDLADPDAYLTAILGSWSPSLRTFEWVCCGHPAPLVLRRDASIAECRGAVAPPLGVAGGSPPRNRVELGVGDRLVLYSDGVTERRRPDGELFGTAGLREAMASAESDSAASLATAILQCVLKVADDPLEDDATLVVLRAL